MAAPGSVAQYAKLIDPAVHKYFTDHYAQLEPKLDAVMAVEDHKDYNTQESVYTGLGQLTSVAEGGTIPADAPIQGYSTTYTPAGYKGVESITMETKLYERDNLVEKAPKMLATAAARTTETQASSIFNNGFSTSYTSYGDAKPLFSTGHLRADGGSSWSNASATGAALTDDNLEVGIIALTEMLDDRGQPIYLTADTIVVPMALKKEALVITKSERRSGTNDNDVNVHNGSMEMYKGLVIPNIVCWNYLGSYLGGSDTAWFLQDSKFVQDGNSVKWKWKQKAKIERDDSPGFLNDMIYYKVTQHASYGWSNPRGNWGSKGDGAAYSN